MKRLIVFALTVLVAWFGVSLLPAASAMGLERPSTVPGYGYDGSWTSVRSADGAIERSPPVAYDRVTAYTADDRWSHGSLARSDGATPLVPFVHDHPAGVVMRGAPVPRIVDRPDCGTWADASALDLSCVAANAGARLEIQIGS